MNEYLFKRDASMDTNLQNSWLYLFTILFNLLFMFVNERDVLFNPDLFFKLASALFLYSTSFLEALVHRRQSSLSFSLLAAALQLLLFSSTSVPL